MQHRKFYLGCFMGFLLLLVCSASAQTDAGKERALLDSLEQAKEGKDKAYWFKELAWFYKSDRPAKAHTYANQSLEIARQLDNRKAIADGLHVQGGIYWYQGKVPEASKSFFQALEIREAINDSLGLARSYNNIGNVYSWQNNFIEANNYYKRSLDLRKALSDYKGMVYSMVSLAEVAAKKDNLKEAQKLGEKALELAKRIGKIDAVAFCYEQLGLIMLSKNQLPKALEYFEDAAEINRKGGNQNQLAENLSEIAEIKARNGAYESAIPLLYESIAISRNIEANDLEADALKQLSENYAMIAQYDSAYYYAINYQKVNDRITGEKKDLLLFDVQEQYRLELDKTGLLIKEQRTFRSFIYALGVIGILIVLFAVYIFSKNRRLHRAKRKLDEKAEEIARVNNVLALQNEDLRQSNDSLQQFAYVVSHDLREPLRTIGSFTTLLARRFPDQIDERSQEYIRFIVKGTKHMSLLLDGLLAYAKVSNTENIELETLQMGELINNVLEILDTEIKETEAHIHVDELPVVSGNKAMLSQLFQNLIANALKFNDKPEKKVWVRYQEHEDMHKLIVEDNGIGINEAYKSKVFQIFHRLEKNKYKGTGLGLAICQKIVARHRGRIELESELGEGTRFIVYLPKAAK
ncbi:MAG: tetratricopeptide repeat protein [Phaeodactylibacter sp.]|nr:tetratricopeptide repeat protein [Phaeodactylibacter sp.]